MIRGLAVGAGLLAVLGGSAGCGGSSARQTPDDAGTTTTPDGGAVVGLGEDASAGGQPALDSDAASAPIDAGSEAGADANVNPDASPTSPDSGRGPTPGGVLSACTPLFGPYNAVLGTTSFGEWMGGDGAYGLLVGSTYLWFHGDTYVNTGGDVSRVGATLVGGNTVGVSLCSGATFDITFDWTVTSQGPEAIFTPGDSSSRYWTGQPFMAGSLMYVPLEVIVPSSGGLGFASQGTLFGIVSNPQDLVGMWSIRYVLVDDLPALGVADGAVVSGDYVYFFNGTSAGTTTLARMPIAQLAANPTAVAPLAQSLDATGNWVAGYDPSNVTAFANLSANSGLTVRFDNRLNEWLAVFADTSSYPVRYISVSTAAELEGPWSPPVHVYAIPDSDPTSPAYDPNVACYAAYEHPEFNPSPDTNVSVTYNCNSATSGYVTANLGNYTQQDGIYFPRFVNIALPASL